MEKCKQFSIFLANKPAVLSQILGALAKAKVNIKTIAMMDSMEHGVLRTIVDDAGKAKLVLKKLNVSFTENDVLALHLPNRPGAAADMCEKLSAAHIDIGYMYCTSGARSGKTTVVIRVPDIRKAIKVLDGTPKGSRKDMKVKLRRPKGAQARR